MDYKIVIPSHKRLHLLKKKTLFSLDLYGIPHDKIYIFVAPDEYEEYKDQLLSYNVVLGSLGLAEQRNSITNYFPEGEHLFCMDDDIRRFLEYTDTNSRHEQQLEDLDSFIKKGFEEAIRANVSLWGLYPVANGRWMKKEVSKGLFFCYGCCFGLINRKDILIESSFKEDYERTLRFYKRDHGVIRCNWVAPVQSFSQQKGGLNESRTLDKEKEGCERVKAMFPDLCSYSLVRGKWTLRLKRCV